jgi:ferredoxin
MGRPLWFVKLIEKVYPLRFLVARTTRVPIIGGIVDRLLFEGDDIVYLPQDHVIQINQPLDVPDEMVLPSQVAAHFIEQANHHWIMDFCICRDGNKCEAYPTDLGCLFLGEATLGINPRFGRRVTKEEALEHLRRCREAGLVHMVGRNKLDTVWLGVGPSNKLLTICNCCPCCCLWGMLPHITPRIGRKVNRMPGVTVVVGDRCVGCGTCAQGVCFVDAICLNNGRAVISDACRGCGRCVGVCPQEAIEISLDGSKFTEIVKETIDRLSPLVDVS